MRVFLLMVLLVAGFSPGTGFDRARWRNADPDSRVRAGMVPDLVKRYGLKGMTRDQVVALLGPASQTRKWPGTELIYVLGNDGGIFAIDHEWLLIELDRQQRVVSFRRTTD